MNMTKKELRLTSEGDRNLLREYLLGRLKHLKKEAKRAGEREEAAYVEGAELEIICAFDELLGEQPPDLGKKPRAH